MNYYIEIFIKLLLAVAVGALIGSEREHKKRPAGFRTNILVCLGATLVQIINIDIINNYRGISNIDPGRLGAQVISGIGFLGAGTILKEGASIKGLTTAATLWVVACIGIAIGNGSYIPGLFAALLVYITLTILKKIENKIVDKNYHMEIDIKINSKPGQIGRIGSALGDLNISILNMEIKDNNADIITAYLMLKLPTNLNKNQVVNTLLKEEGIVSIDEL